MGDGQAPAGRAAGMAAGMAAVGATLPFAVARTYDQEMASDGESRYGFYARQAAVGDPWLWETEDDGDRRRAFAALAWRAATGPAMSPGYVRHHRLISSSTVVSSSYDGMLVASVQVRTSPPAGLGRLPRWLDWPTEMYGDQDVPVSPSDEQVMGHSGFVTGYALTTVNLVFRLRDVVLPPVPAGPDSPDVASAAAAAVGALVGVLNDAVSPVLEAL